MNTKVREEGGGKRAAPGAGAEITRQPMERTTVEKMDISGQEMQLVESPHWTKFFPEVLQPMRRAHAGAGEQRDEEELSEIECYERTATPIPHSPSQPGMSPQCVWCPICQLEKDVSENVWHLRCDWMH